MQGALKSLTRTPGEIKEVGLVSRRVNNSAGYSHGRMAQATRCADEERDGEDTASNHGAPGFHDQLILLRRNSSIPAITHAQLTSNA